ncbi:MAG: elongation factor P [Deltaproteobacteria bacterium RBG_16_54_11]|jgi:elongation factor P|nr:MAG: elongation factor P [Deltaproteobacteria bacterium RBG_16_54_11]
MTASTADFRKGLKIELEGEPYVIADFLHVKPGKGGAFVRTKLKSLITGNVIDRTFRSGEKVQTPALDEKNMQYLYREGNAYHFMDNDTYEQLTLTGDQVGEDSNFLQENVKVRIVFHNGQPLGVELPFFVQLTIVRTEPGVRGDSARGGTKPATVETGAVIQVPLFINEGDVIKVDTRTGEYIERAK